MNKPHTVPTIQFTFPRGGIATMDADGLTFDEAHGFSKADVYWTRDTLAYLVSIWTLTYDSEVDEDYEGDDYYNDDTDGDF
jgi:hypothetical protein